MVVMKSKTSNAGKGGAYIACAFGLIMLFFSGTAFDVVPNSIIKVLAMVGAGTVLILFIFFLNWRLTLASLIPVLFSLISTLGTLKLAGLHLDIAILTLPIAPAMSIGYSMFFVRSYQRYGDPSHPSFRLIRTAVFVSSASAIIGFGALCPSGHPVLQAVGLTGICGITYALIATFVILPPLLAYLFRKREDERYPENPRARVLRRYKNMEPYPRFFARFKIRFDPMFSELNGLLETWSGIRTILDIGTGYGVPAAWCLERFSKAKVYGIEPDCKRVRVASRAIGERGRIVAGQAPDIPKAPELADAALMLDMMHYLSDDQLEQTLKGIKNSLRINGRLVIRALVPTEKPPSFLWRCEDIRLRIFKISAYYRSAREIREKITRAGFEIETALQSDFNNELYWFIAKAV
jgi:SAM-dependent methyltransferase